MLKKYLKIRGYVCYKKISCLRVACFLTPIFLVGDYLHCKNLQVISLSSDGLSERLLTVRSQVQVLQGEHFFFIKKFIL